MRVPGHRLIARGAPHTGQACTAWPCDTVAGVKRVNRHGTALDPEADVRVAGHGHALCECGWTGAHLLSGAERRRDHAVHKAAVRSTGRARLRVVA